MTQTPLSSPAEPTYTHSITAPLQTMLPTHAFTQIPRIPPKVVKAIAQVQAKITKLEKGEENKFGGYRYTSVDQIYDLVRGLMAEAGMIILPVELRPTVLKSVDTAKGVKQWGEFHIGFILAVDDEQFFDERASETLFVQIEGTQTFHAAKSYAQKTFLRGLFKISTGELDLDATEKVDAVQEQAPAKAGKPTKAEKAKPLDPFESEKKKAEILDEIAKLKPMDAEASEFFVMKWAGIIETLRPHHADEVRKAYKGAR